MEQLSLGEMTALLSGVGVVATAVLSLIGVVIANVVTKRLRERELFQSALDFLTGGTQKRSIGIAILRDHAEAGYKKNVVAAIFQAQMLHLEDERHDRSASPRKIEYYNYRMMEETLKSLDSDFSRLLSKP